MSSIIKIKSFLQFKKSWSHSIVSTPHFLTKRAKNSGRGVWAFPREQVKLHTTDEYIAARSSDESQVKTAYPFLNLRMITLADEKTTTQMMMEMKPS